MNKIFSVLFFFISLHGAAQKIYGTVFNSNGDLLPYASIFIKGSTVGSSANANARFSLSILPGKYTIVCQHIGFTKQEKSVIITNEDTEMTFVLAQQKLNLKEVIVSTSDEDPAYQIIRNAIKKRNYYSKQVAAFDCDLYTKDIMKLRKIPKTIFGKKISESGKKEMGLDSTGKGVIFLQESIAKVHTQLPNKFKMQILSSRVSGSGSFGFTFPTFISLYNNNIKIFTEKFNPRGFISPIADNALQFYKYKFLGSFFEDEKEINTIKVTPRRNYEPLFSGIIYITQNDWRIHSFRLSLTTNNQLEIIDTLQITQIHVPINNEIWQVKNQLLHFNFKQLGIDAIGDFVSIYSNYNIAPSFSKKYFNNIIIQYDTDVTKKTTAYWDTIRPVPLELDEKNDYQIKDSIYQVHKSEKINKHIADSLNKQQGKIQLVNIFWSGINRKYYTTLNINSWGMQPLIKNVSYNTVEGLVVGSTFYYNSYFKKLKSNFLFEPNFRYGFSNKHFNTWGNLIFSVKDNSINKKIKNQSYFFSGGKRISQFNKASTVDEFGNAINTLFWGDNFMKIYENKFFNAGFSKVYENGFKLSISTLYEDRIPLNNTTNFTVFKKDTSNITPNYPYEKINTQFTAHKAFLASIDIIFKLGQQYIQFPNYKMPLDFVYPTLHFNYTKGLKNIFGSNVNFDKWSFIINDTKNFNLAGEFKYKIGVGGFLNNKIVFIQDYQHFNGNRSNNASEYVNSFQLAPYYANSTIANFYTFGHVEHHFNGLLTNKIPLFKKLNWHMVAGSNAFYVNSTNNYAEVFIGMENILKIFRVDIVSAYENGKSQITDYRIGLGGTIGGNIKPSSKTNEVTIGL